MKRSSKKGGRASKAAPAVQPGYKLTLARKNRELDAMREQLDKLGTQLELTLAANDALYDRLMLALDGAKPPKGTLSTVEALEPFARAFALVRAVVIPALFDDDATIDMILLQGSAVVNAGGKLTLGHLRTAARTLDWIKQGKLGS